MKQINGTTRLWSSVLTTRKPSTESVQFKRLTEITQQPSRWRNGEFRGSMTTLKKIRIERLCRASKRSSNDVNLLWAMNSRHGRRMSRSRQTENSINNWEISTSMSYSRKLESDQERSGRMAPPPLKKFLTVTFLMNLPLVEQSGPPWRAGRCEMTTWNRNGIASSRPKTERHLNNYEPRKRCKVTWKSSSPRTMTDWHNWTIDPTFDIKL